MIQNPKVYQADLHHWKAKNTELRVYRMTSFMLMCSRFTKRLTTDILILELTTLLLIGTYINR